MFKKKRLAVLVFVAALAYVAVAVDVWLAAGAAALFVVLLGGLSLVNMARAHQGIDDLRNLHARYGYGALTEAARARIAAADDFHFVVLGDTRNKIRIASMVYERAAGEQPAAIFHTGDIIRHGTAREFLENHVALLEKIVNPIPMFCVPGNHERGARRDFAAFKALYGADRFSIDLGVCRFVGFNNSAHGRLRSGDLAFLRDALGKPGAKYKFVFLHIPPVFFEDTFAHDRRRRGFRERADEMHRLCVEQGVNEVFMAHIHGYATAVFDGVRYTLTAGGGAPLDRRLAPEARAYNYVVVRVTPEGLRREVALCIDGNWSRKEE